MKSINALRLLLIIIMAVLLQLVLAFVFSADGKLIAGSSLLIIAAALISYFLQFKKASNTETVFTQNQDTIQNLETRIEELNNEIKQYEEKLKSALFMSDREKNDFCKLYHDLTFYQSALGNLIHSITGNLSTTTSPISRDLLAIQSEIKGFLSRISQYDEEISKKTSLKLVMHKNEEIKSGTEIVSKAVSDTFYSFNKNLDTIDAIIGKIFESSKEIEDIADKVNILSINAAIEASRSGSDGKGFKVISEEIKKLSGHTFNFLKEIKNTIKESRVVISGINADFKVKEQNIIDRVKDQELKSAESYDIFSRYYQDFESIYSQIQIFIEIIRGKVTNISPVVQLHEITIQEAENLNGVIADFFNLAALSLKKSAGDICREAGVTITEAVGRIRGHLTTSRELDALEKTIHEIQPGEPVDLKRENKSIELF